LGRSRRAAKLFEKMQEEQIVRIKIEAVNPDGTIVIPMARGR
jgi:hypothetical protein